MCFAKGEHVILRPCHAIKFPFCNLTLRIFAIPLINSINTGNVGRPIVTLGDAHGYMGRLREEFEQQTSKLSRRELTKATQFIFQS